MKDFPERWMWSEAFDMLARVDRLHRQFFQPMRSQERFPAWEPPVDVLETESELLVLVALPGVDPDQVEVAIEGSDLVVAGKRILPPQLQTAVIHRLELPQGYFKRRIPLPGGHYDGVERAAAYGCLVITLRKAGAAHG